MPGFARGVFESKFEDAGLLHIGVPKGALEQTAREVLVEAKRLRPEYERELETNPYAQDKLDALEACERAALGLLRSIDNQAAKPPRVRRGAPKKTTAVAPTKPATPAASTQPSWAASTFARYKKG